MAERNHKGNNATKTDQNSSVNNMHRQSVSQEVQLSQGQSRSSASREVVRTQERGPVQSICSNSNSTTHSNSAAQQAVSSSNPTELRESVSRREIKQSRMKGKPTDSK